MPTSVVFIIRIPSVNTEIEWVSLATCEIYRHFHQFIDSLLLCWKTYCFKRERERKFYLTTHSTHFIYGYMASDIWLRTILIVRKETCCRHIGYSYRLTASVLLYSPSHRQDNTYHSLCYTSRGVLAGTRNSSNCFKRYHCEYNNCKTVQNMILVHTLNDTFTG